MLLLSRINACPCTASSAYARVPCWCTSPAHPFCSRASSGLMQACTHRKIHQAGKPSHLQTAWVDVTSTWAHPNPPSTLESSTLTCHPANLRRFLLASHNKKLPREIPGEHFIIVLLGSIICLLCIYENISLEIFIKVQEDAQHRFW